MEREERRGEERPKGCDRVLLAFRAVWPVRLGALASAIKSLLAFLPLDSSKPAPTIDRVPKLDIAHGLFFNSFVLFFLREQ